jgi:hypothetical protein
MAKTFADARETWAIHPPAEVITPEVARGWLYRSYPPLARLASLCAWPEQVRGLGRRGMNESAVSGLRLLALDVRRITEACGKVLATGRPIKMRVRERHWSYCKVARDLRCALEYERRHPHRGTRQVLRQALQRADRLAKSQPRSWTGR